MYISKLLCKWVSVLGQNCKNCLFDFDERYNFISNCIIFYVVLEGFVEVNFRKYFLKWKGCFMSENKVGWRIKVKDLWMRCDLERKQVREE